MEIFQKIQKDLQNQHIEPEDFEDRIIFMSMFKDIDWTKKKFSRMSFEFRKRSRITQTGFRVDIGLSSVQEKKTHGVERTPANLKEVEYFCWCHGGKFQQKWRSDFPRCQSVESRILEKERWKMYDQLQCGNFECRALISHDSLSKSAQYLRSSFKMV